MATRGGRTAYLALNNRGNVFSLQGKHYNALEDYSRSIELNPQYVSSGVVLDMNQRSQNNRPELPRTT